MKDTINQEIEELSKIKISIIEIKRSYQDIDASIEIKKEIKEMIENLDKIYNELFNSPDKMNLFNMYGEFYLPTISKIISKYCNLANKKIKSNEEQELLNNIENTLKKLNIHFQEKFNSLFEAEIIDLDADIKVLLKELKMR